jgi:MFS family permease
MGTTKQRLAFTFFVLVGINTMNFYDRQVVAAVQENIKDKWHLSDLELGALTLAFIVLYAIVGLPLGRLADTKPRRLLLAVGCGLWSLMTLGSGLAWNYLSLFLMRLGVGVGEASCAPAGNSLIGDLVPAERRARALSVFMIGLPVGLALSSIFSGTIAQYFKGTLEEPWRAPLFVAAVPGMLLALAALFIVEPARGSSETHAPPAHGGGTDSAPGGETPVSTATHAAPAPGEGLSFFATVRHLFSMPTMWFIIASGALLNFNMYPLGQFLPSLLKRYHLAGVDQAVAVARAGQVTGLIQGFGALSIFAAGWLGDRAYRRGVSGRLHVAWIGIALAVPTTLLSLGAPRGDLWLCAAWMVPGYGLLYFYYGTVYATIQDIVEPPLRGTAMAVYFCGQYLGGAAMGSLVTGWISDIFAGREAAAAGRTAVIAEDMAIGLHKAMYIVPILDAVLVFVLIGAALTVKKDYLRLRERMRAAAAGHEGNVPAADAAGVTDRPS